MNAKQQAAVIAVSAASTGAILEILVSKGVISKAEVVQKMQGMANSTADADNGPIFKAVFTQLAVLFSKP